MANFDSLEFRTNRFSLYKKAGFSRPGDTPKSPEHLSRKTSFVSRGSLSKFITCKKPYYAKILIILFTPILGRYIYICKKIAFASIAFNRIAYNKQVKEVRLEMKM